MGEDSNWASTNFSGTSEVGEGDSLSSFPSETITGTTGTDHQSDDLSFDIISRHKLSLTPKSTGSNHDRPSPKATGAVPCFEEDTRSSWSVDSTKNISFKEATIDEDSQNSFSSQKSSLKRRYSDDEVTSAYGGSVFPAENLFEYQWPPDKGEFYILQEQISDYLGIKSFKRKYPDLVRRPVDMDEKQFLRERGVVSETQCDLGLMALRSDDVMELMSKDYPDKYHEYVRVLQEKERQSINDKHREYTTPSVDKSKMADFVKKAIQSAAEYNANINHERREERCACFDLQTFTVHYPTGKMARTDKESTKVGHYPVAVLPGQYRDYYRKYTPQELKYLPVNTVLYGPLQELSSVHIQPTSDGSHSDSEESSASEASCCSSSQGTHDCSGESSSGSEAGCRPAGTVNMLADKNSLPSGSVPNYKPKYKPNALCKVCKGGSDKNKEGKAEELVHCSECTNSSHPSCLEFTAEMVEVVKTYPWQCMDCKTCMHCMDPYDEDKMMFCDQCDRGYHTFCVGLKSLPSGRWICQRCAICAVCGSFTPGPEGSRAQWQHEFIKITRPDGETVRRQQVLCVNCCRQRKR